MKYRRLKADELQSLEKEFVHFLAAQTITAQDWEKIKLDQPERAEELIKAFSDDVFESVIKNVQYLEYKTPNDIKTFYFGEEMVQMLGLTFEGKADLDFTQNIPPAQMMEKLRQSGANLKMYKAEKKYKSSKAQEIFNMMENGALISNDGLLYNTLKQLTQ